MTLTVPVFEIVETSENRSLAKDETRERALLGDIANKGVCPAICTKGVLWGVLTCSNYFIDYNILLFIVI